MRRQPDPPLPLGLEIEATLHVHHQRHLAGWHILQPQLHHRPAIGRDADRRDTAGHSDIIRPSPGGIDQQAAFDRPVTGLDPPAIALSFGALQPGPQPHFAAQPAEPAQIGLMQRPDIDVAATRFQHAQHPVGPQPRHQARRHHRLQFDRPGKIGQQRVAQPFIPCPADMQRAARREEGAIEEIGIGRLQQRARGRGQRLDHRPAIGFFPEGDRSPRRMIAGAILHLQDQHPRRFRQRRAQAGACNPATDNHDIGSVQRATSSRKRSIRPSASSRTGSSSRRISCAASRP